MLHLNYNRGLVGLGFSFFTWLGTHHIAVAQKTKNKEAKDITISSQTKTFDHAGSATGSDVQRELERENALNRARLEKQLSTTIAQIEQLRLEREHKRLTKEIGEENARAAHDKAMIILNMEKERLTIELELVQARFMQQMTQYNTKLTELDKKIQVEKGKTQFLQETTYRLQAEIEALHAKKARDNFIQKKPIYLKDPLIKQDHDHILVLSDRCIQLNGYITPWQANYIVDQIQYFNNKNIEYPIFIVIDASPGGSTCAGDYVLQAINHSKAPVYVVVKRFAASMAALIATLATKSYIYPNARILHHQPMSSCYGNVRTAKEHYEVLYKIWELLGGRVAQKMGISLKDFEKKLYQKSMYGDWEEYGDAAKKIKWIDFVIHGIQDSAVSSLPDSTNYTFEKYIKQYYGCDKGTVIAQTTQEKDYYALALHDFDYSYRPDRKAQING